MRVDSPCPNKSVEKLQFHSMLKLNNFIYFKYKAMFEIALDLKTNISYSQKNSERYLVKI